MTFPLEPPYTRGGFNPNTSDHEAVAEGPLLVRTRTMSRWHRVKTGIRFTDQGGRISWDLWCGQSASDTNTIGRDDLPTDGLPVCGPCEGKALGAGYNGTAAIVAGEALLLFEPESQTRFRPPTRCPGSGRSLWLPADVPAADNVGRCAVCGLHVALGWRRRGTGYSCDSWEAPKDHAPGEDLVEPCLFHAWDSLTIHHGAAVCACALQRLGQPA